MKCTIFALANEQKPFALLDSFEKNLSTGEVLEWLKRHAWKACKRLKRFGGSNPPLSASNSRNSLSYGYFYIILLITAHIFLRTVSSAVVFRFLNDLLNTKLICRQSKDIDS